MDDIKHDPDPLLTRMMNLMWRYDKDPSADALVDVLNEAAAEIERLRALLERAYRLAVGHGPNWNVFDGWEEAISAYEEARRG